MAVTPSAALGQARPDLRDGLDEFDLAANQAGFIGLSLAPVIEVVTQSGKYPKLELAEILKKKKDAKRASGANYSRGGRQGTSGSFATDEYGAEEPVDSRNAEIYGDWWDSEVLAAQGARDQVLQNLEDRVERYGSRHRLDHSRHGDTGRQRDDGQESRPRSNRDRPERDGDRVGSTHGPPAMHGDP
jgi:hypothetical protein